MSNFIQQNKNRKKLDIAISNFKSLKKKRKKNHTKKNDIILNHINNISKWMFLS